MPRRRPPSRIWKELRRIVWNRDNRMCVKCKQELLLNKAHIDHLVSGRLGTNKISNLRTLCRRCHVLRADKRHRGMIGKALKDGIIPPNWREHIWRD
jgi:5-methylcytosine-specific restriction enzyme A